MNKTLKRIKATASAAVLCLLTVGLAPLAQAAQDPVSYREPVYKTVGGVTSPTNGIDHWETKTTNVYNLVKADTATLSEGWWVVDGTVDHSSAGIIVSGAAHLILKDGCSLTVSGEKKDRAGIQVSGTGNSLAIYGQSTGTGKLTATGDDYCAGIGGSHFSYFGSNITINGGTVIAMGGSTGAGIGGGNGKGSTGSNITINGGTVTATGESTGAGIGGGYCGTGSNITINGGTVTATGGSDGAGIGSGKDGGVASEIYAAAYLVMKADGSEPPTEKIEYKDGEDIASKLAGRRYATVEDILSKHTICLKGGEAYLDDDNEANKVTDLVAVKGLTYTAGVWTMSNFNFTTTDATALVFADGGTKTSPVAISIKVEGANTITGGDSSKDTTVGMLFSGKYANVTISGSGAAESKLAVTAGATTASGTKTSVGLYLAGEGQTLMLVGLTADFNGANAPLTSVGAYSAAGNVTVGDGAEVFSAGLSASGVSVASGILMGNDSILKVEGTGKLVAKCAGEGAGGNYAVAGQNEPDAKAVATGTETALAWDAESNTYMNGATIATDVTLTAKAFPVTVVLPVVTGATAQLLAFNANGGWASVATNEVPSNATVRVVWTADEGKGLTGAGAANVFTWQAELVASKSIQTAPAPTVGETGETEVTLNIDTRATKAYFDTADILPVWYAQGAEVKVSGATLVKSAANTNTVSWAPDSLGVYDFSQTGGLTAQIIYTTPVEVTTNGIDVAGTAVEVTIDGSPLPEDGIVATNSTIVATWTAAPGVFFMDGTTTYTQTFTADKAVNAAGEAVTMPESPAAPKVLLGAVAQRYPWDGKIDVQYWAKNTPNEGYEIEVTVTLPGGTKGAKTLQASEKHACRNGKNETTFDAKAAFGEVAITKGVKVTAKLVEK